MLASLASVGYLQGYASRTAVNGVAQTSRSAAVMQFDQQEPPVRDMKGDVITSVPPPPMCTTAAFVPTATERALSRADDGMASNYRRLSDKLKEADVERRIEEEEVTKRPTLQPSHKSDTTLHLRYVALLPIRGNAFKSGLSSTTGQAQRTLDCLNPLSTRASQLKVNKREHGMQMARESLARKKALMAQIPEATNVGTIADFMFKARLTSFTAHSLAQRSTHGAGFESTLRAQAGVQDILAELDRDLVGLKPVKTRVREIASLLASDRASNSAPKPDPEPQT